MSINLKYAHLEREFRWLLKAPVDFGTPEKVMEIHDRYLEGTNLRLREIHEVGMEPLFKLGQKLRMDGRSASSIACTSMYLVKEEFELLSRLPAKLLSKSRSKYTFGDLIYSVDIFLGPLKSLVLLEVDVGEESIAKPVIAFDEAIDVTNDDRFTGGQLSCLSAEELKDLLSEF